MAMTKEHNRPRTGRPARAGRRRRSSALRGWLAEGTRRESGAADRLLLGSTGGTAMAFRQATMLLLAPYYDVKDS